MIPSLAQFLEHILLLIVPAQQYGQIIHSQQQFPTRFVKCRTLFPL